MKKNLLPLLAFALLASCNMEETLKKITYPETRTVDHTDDYFGQTVADSYRWLEDDIAEEVIDWGFKQTEVTEAYFEQIKYRKALRNRIEKLMDYTKYSVPRLSGEWLLYSKNEGLENQALLYVQNGESSTAEVLINPNKLSDDGTVALQRTSFSKNQKYFAYSVSAAGSDWQTIYIMDFEKRTLIEETLEYVKFTNIAWNGDDGFYYSGYDRPEDEAKKFSNKTEYQKVYYHKVGTPQSEDQIVYQDLEHPLRYVTCQITEDGGFLILNISEGTDGSEIKVKNLNMPGASWKLLVPGFKTNAYIVDQKGDNLLLYTNDGAPNYKVVEVNPNNPGKQNWKEIIPETENKLEGVSTVGGYLFAQYLKDVTSHIVRSDYDGQNKTEIELPGKGSASGFSGAKDDKAVYYSYTSFNYPSTIFKYDLSENKSSVLHEAGTDFDPELFETKQVFYASKDGTKVPMFITHKKGLQLDGNNPTMLYAYGGFNISLTPSFNPTNMAFIENGGVYCVANLRGGGEYGEEWHRGGMLHNKQNVFDDFIAAAEYLIAEKYTKSEKLAIRGGSNGGLLVGACMTQRPELYAVAIPQVGVLDMLRFHKFTVGWGWVPEYGSSDSANHIDFLMKYSPLHNLKKDVCYPATLITTGDHDDRVVPAHSFKYAAALQAVQSCEKPTLIRIDRNAGHGAGKPISKIIDEAADIWSFVFYNLKMNPSL